jgi:23S rRNA pseudouridine2605 synthase
MEYLLSLSIILRYILSNTLFSKLRKEYRSIGADRLPIVGAIVVMFWLRFASCRHAVTSIPHYCHHVHIEEKLYISMFTNVKRNSFIQQPTFSPYHSLSQCHRRHSKPSPSAAFVSVLSPHQVFYTTKTKTRAETGPTTRWRSPVLRSSHRTSEKRPPRLFKRTNLLNKNDDEAASDEKLYRADRVLSNRTGKSRKECFQLLQERRVFIVTDQIFVDPERDLSRSINSGSTAAIDETPSDSSENKIQQYRLKVITGPAMKLSMHTPLRIDKYQEVALPPPLLMVYHKPKVNGLLVLFISCFLKAHPLLHFPLQWVLSVRRDPAGRPCLDDVLLGGNPDSIKPNAVPPLHPVGRLDYDTTGLLLFSSSGPLTQSLLHPKHEIEKEYRAVVTGVVNEEKLRAELEAGVTTGEGVHSARLVSAEPNTPADDDVAAYLANIKAALPSEYNATELKTRGYLDIFDATSLSTVTLVVSEGKHRMVRRILANVGHPVVSLHRLRLGEISLGDVPIGQTRMLTPKELNWAQKQLKQGSKPLHPTEKKIKATIDESDDEDVL